MNKTRSWKEIHDAMDIEPKNGTDWMAITIYIAIGLMVIDLAFNVFRV